MSARHGHELVGADPEPPFTIRFGDREIPVIPGQTIGAALWAAGIRSWRTTRFAGRPRGLFCGIGACFDCLLSVDGGPALRACVTEARPGDVVAPPGERAAGDASGAPRAPREEGGPDA